MKNIYAFILVSAALCFAGKLNIDFNDASPSLEIDFLQIKTININPAGFVFIEGGTFQMGDHFNEGDASELPLHSVAVSDFYMGKTEVTQSEWAQYMPAYTYDYGVGDDYPVYYASWYDILVYCNKRSISEELTPCYTINGSTDPVVWGTVPTSSNTLWDAVSCNWDSNGYRLPTEAEWEYAARGGINWNNNLRYSGCNTDVELTSYAWYNINSSNKTHPVAKKLPNQLGIFDMSGNEWEFCWDWSDGTFYTTCNNLGIVTNPNGTTSGSNRIVRGGVFDNTPLSCRVATRGYYIPYSSGRFLGFRIARKP